MSTFTHQDALHHRNIGTGKGPLIPTWLLGSQSTNLSKLTPLDGIDCKLPNAENVSVDKDHGSLPRLSCTDDVVYEKIVEFLHKVLIREKKSDSRIAGE